MFNEEIKRRYINENKARNLNLERQAEVLFNRCEAYEERIDKDICCFNTTDIIGLFKSYNTVSLESLMNAKSQYKIYTDWCIANKILVRDRQNHFREINNEMLRQCLNYYLKSQRVITREYILDNWDALLNPAERFILLGVFEGIGCNTNIAYKDFEDLTLSQFDTENGVLRLEGRAIRYSKELYHIAQEASDTYETIAYDRRGVERHIKLIDTDTIVKPAKNARSCDYRNIMIKKMQKIKVALNNPVISFQTLKESGRIEMINGLVKRGMTIEAALSDAEVINTYGRMPAKKRYISNYYNSSGGKPTVLTVG